MRAIAKAPRTTVAEINEVIDRWAASAIEEKIRKNTLAPELARRCVMLGLSTPQTAVLQIVDEARSQETSTDRIERVLNALIEDQKKNDPTTH
jgi:hypothetical protein